MSALIPKPLKVSAILFTMLFVSNAFAQIGGLCSSTADIYSYSVSMPVADSAVNFKTLAAESETTIRSELGPLPQGVNIRFHMITKANSQILRVQLYQWTLKWVLMKSIFLIDNTLPRDNPLHFKLGNLLQAMANNGSFGSTPSINEWVTVKTIRCL